MIITGIIPTIIGAIAILLTFKIPSIPDSAMEYIDTFFSYLEAGASILANYTPLPYLMTLFGIILVIDAAILVYKLVMWVIRKIPTLGMS